MKKLYSILNINRDDFSKYKIHFAYGSKPNDRLEPLREFQRGKFKEWQEGQNCKNFEREYILSLIFYGKDKWLFAGIYSSKECIKKPNEKRFEYDTELIDIGKDFIGEIVNYHKSFRSAYVYGEKYIDDFIVSED
ncbi:hypothetical protein [Clostridium pasteurianum]|uniref:Uncharacterized protein n=1 Tax=Clostridium pasteurianum BC1 TaxID=86416 RepID=R4KAQ8_CLOPA|nr:hypothetical protein [Clostridium pasteurianum]AGK97589.1 hypothetical protein Clopa_2749 [Clostridium pasteurianum BC1]